VARYVVTDEADEDIYEIALYIARDNPSAALNMVDEFERKFAQLAESPAAGREREELSPGLRSFPVKSFLIFFRESDDGIEIIRVLSGFRDIDSLF